jgi:hypothetical protein
LGTEAAVAGLPIVRATSERKTNFSILEVIFVSVRVLLGKFIKSFQHKRPQRR